MIKLKLMCRYFISICLALGLLLSAQAQTTSKDNKKEVNDTVIYKSPYGLRLGIDISKPIKASLDQSYSGFEIVGDYRISKRFFIAAEIGYEEENTVEDYSNSTAKGSYMRVVFNFNSYKNWLDMNNEIFLGMRYGLSFFDQTLNSYTTNITDPDIGIYFPPNTVTTPQTSSLHAHWTEFVVGIKSEVLQNTFIGLSVSYKILVSSKEPENFKTLYAPGFNRIFESGTGFGFNYTVSYLIPFKKK